MLYHIVNAGMTLSVLFFSIGYLYRKNVTIHQGWMITGVLSNIISAVILVIAIHGFFDSDMQKAGFIPVVPEWVVTTHRSIAVFAFLSMIGMLYTGAKRMRSVHLKLQYVFIILYLVVFVSGLFIFKGA